MQIYFLTDEFDELKIIVINNTIKVDCWSERENRYVALDVSPWFIQGMIDELGLNLIVGERLGWREMGSEYSWNGYFAVMPA